MVYVMKYTFDEQQKKTSCFLHYLCSNLFFYYKSVFIQSDIFKMKFTLPKKIIDNKDLTVQFISNLFL